MQAQLCASSVLSTMCRVSGLQPHACRQSEQLDMGQELEANVSAGPIALELVSAPGKMLTRAGQAVRQLHAMSVHACHNFRRQHQTACQCS